MLRTSLVIYCYSSRCRVDPSLESSVKSEASEPLFTTLALFFWLAQLCAELMMLDLKPDIVKVTLWREKNPRTHEQPRSQEDSDLPERLLVAVLWF